MFKISSRSQMKQRALRNSRKALGEIQTGSQQSQNPDPHLSPGGPQDGGTSMSNSMILETPTNTRNKITALPNSNLDRVENLSISYPNHQTTSMMSAGRTHELRITEEDEDMVLESGPLSASNKSRRIKVQEKELDEIQRVNQQNEKHATANFGALKVYKQHMSQVNKNNYSALKGGPDEEILEDESSNGETKNQMFTSMSDIGFPSNIHNYNLKVNKQKERVNKKELITPD